MGFGRIEGRPVAYSASDATIKGASGGYGSRRRGTALHRIVDHAALPMFELAQGGGARITDIMTSRFAGNFGAGLGRRLAFPRRGAMFLAVMGNYYAPWNVADADFSVVTRSSNLSISSPPVVEEATGLKVDPMELGGAEMHARVTGQVDLLAADDREAIATLRRVFAYLPGDAWEEPPTVASGDPPGRTDESLRRLVPSQPNRAYDMGRLVRSVFDGDSVLELLPEFARNLLAGLARLDGHPVTFIANQPMFRAGSIDLDACIKISRILTMCERFRLPLISFIDVPGVLPTPEQERRRLLAHVYALAIQRLRAPIPKISVVVRKAYGYAYYGMSGADHEWFGAAWPSAQIAFMGPEPAVRVAFRREWEAAADSDAFLQERAEEFRRLAEPWDGADLGYLDNVLDPAETRPWLVRALEVSLARMTWKRPTG